MLDMMFIYYNNYMHHTIAKQNIQDKPPAHMKLTSTIYDLHFQNTFLPMKYRWYRMANAFSSSTT